MKRNLLLMIIMFFCFITDVYGQDYTTTVADCQASIDQSTGDVFVTCTPNYANPFASFRYRPTNTSCPRATAWKISGNGSPIVATNSSGGYSTNVTIQVGTPFGIHLQGAGGVACTDSGDLSLSVYDRDASVDFNANTYCYGRNPNYVAYGYVPDVQCSFTPSNPGTYELYFYTNIGIQTHTPFTLTVTP